MCELHYSAAFLGVQVQRTTDCQTVCGRAARKGAARLERCLCRDNTTSECEMLQITEGEQPAHRWLTLPHGTADRTAPGQRAERAGDNTLLAVNSIEASRKAKPG